MKRRTLLKLITCALPTAALSLNSLYSKPTEPISLDIHVQDIEGDSFSEIITADPKKAEKGFAMSALMGPLIRLYDDQTDRKVKLKLPNFHQYNGSLEANEGNKISVAYVTQNELVNKVFATPDAYLDFFKANDKVVKPFETKRKNIGDGAKNNFFKQSLEKQRDSYQKLFGRERPDNLSVEEFVDNVVEQYLFPAIKKKLREQLGAVGGIADPAGKRVYLLSSPKIQDGLHKLVMSEQGVNSDSAIKGIQDYFGFTSLMLGHEIGHVLGLTHSEPVTFPNGDINVMASPNDCLDQMPGRTNVEKLTAYTSIIRDGAYRFSDSDSSALKDTNGVLPGRFLS